MKYVLPVRRNLQFFLPTEKIDSWNAGGVHWTHFMNTLSVFFPAGERFFIQSVRNYRDQITDKELQKAISMFIGQEAFHTREHEEYNEVMEKAGVPLQELEGTVVTLLDWVAKTPKPVQLAVTVSLEHLTAMMADALMENEQFMSTLSDPHYTALWQWHAMEETEHKGVAYDVYEAVMGKGVGSYALRAVAFLAANLIFWSLFYRYYYVVLKSRGFHKDISGWVKSFRLQFGPKGLFPTMFGEWATFLKPGFHPWDLDNSYVLDKADDLLKTVDTFAEQAGLAVA